MCIRLLDSRSAAMQRERNRGKDNMNTTLQVAGRGELAGWLVGMGGRMTGWDKGCG